MKNMVTFANDNACFTEQLHMDTIEQKIAFPCSYTQEQMEASLREAEEDYQNGRCVSHSSICERYGI
ncbi:MAG: hypothetical protein IKM85_09640 [Bacteroidales bacterium]|nr:hypothetical protein [Bacteroidales bacterium]